MKEEEETDDHTPFRPSRRIALFAAVIAVAGFGLRSIEAAPATSTAKTLDNLNAAFNGESNAHYLAFATKADIQVPDVKSTKENLEAAIKGESYERDTMYPEFLAQARKEGQRDAIETFNFAKSVEAEHAKLYTAALDNLGALKGSQAKPFYVCTVCGDTTTRMNFEKCPVCFNSKDKYVQVS